MNSFNFLPDEILNLNREDFLLDKVVLADSISKVLEKNLLGVDDIITVFEKKNYYSSMYCEDVQNTFTSKELSKLFYGLDSGYIDKETFGLLTETVKLDLSKGSYEDSEALNGEFRIYDIDSFFYSDKSFKISECTDLDYLKKQIKDFGISGCSCIYNIDDTSKLEYDGENSKIKQFVLDINNFFSSNSEDYDKFLEISEIDKSKDFEEMEKMKDLVNFGSIYSLKQNLFRYDSLRESLLLDNSLNKFLEDKLSDLGPITKLTTDFSISSGPGYNSKEATFKTDEVIMLLDSFISGDVNEKEFTELTKTFKLDLFDGGWEDSRSFDGEVKIYDIKKYLQNKDTLDIEDCLNVKEISDILKHFSNVTDLDSYPYISFVEYEFKEDSKLSYFLDAVKNSVEEENFDNFVDLISDSDLAEAIIDIKSSEFDINSLASEK